MNRKKGFGFLLVALFFLFAMVPISKVEAKISCYVFYYDSQCSDFYYPSWNYFLIAMDQEGNFLDQFGDSGVWEYYGSSMQLSYASDSTNCYPMISGTKKQGFYKCTDGSWWGPYLPGCWYLKKTKFSYCGFLSVEPQEETESGPMGDGFKDFRR